MTESEAHKNLKRRACDELVKAGFKREEIREEHRINIEDNRWFLIDIAGIKDDKTVAYECGNTPLKKLSKLKESFDKVIWLPYLSTKVRLTKEKPQGNNEFDMNLNDKGYGSFPRELRGRWGIRLSIIPMSSAGVIFGRKADLRDVEKSLEILLQDVKHRREKGERKRTDTQQQE